tara:strand:+ start:3561 stop:3749 length:189 start_codon:yes stop_codon:yes gene_type:complete
MVVNTLILSNQATNAKIYPGTDAAQLGTAVQTIAQVGAVALPLAILQQLPVLSFSRVFKHLV